MNGFLEGVVHSYLAGAVRLRERPMGFPIAWDKGFG